VGVASFFLAPDTATDQVVAEMEKMIGAQGANAVRQVIESSRGFGKGVWAVSVGIVTLIMGATAVFGELQSALNQMWDVEAKPDRGVITSFVVDRVRSFSIAICVGFLLLVSLVISAVISGLQNYMNNWLPGIPWVWQMANIVASFFVIAVLFAAIYKFLPDVVISWRDVSIGAAFWERSSRRFTRADTGQAFARKNMRFGSAVKPIRSDVTKAQSSRIIFHGPSLS